MLTFHIFGLMGNKDQTQKKISLQVELYNMVPNLLWSLLCIIPVVYFCYHYLPQKLLYIFLGISVLAYFLPVRFYNFLQVKDQTFLEGLGVDFVQRYTQDGKIINNFIRKKFPGYKKYPDKKAMQVKYNNTYNYERFHLMALIFFLCISILALLKFYYKWAFTLTLSNIIYNVYPILLQHYTRLRITALLKQKNK